MTASITCIRTRLPIQHQDEELDGIERAQIESAWGRDYIIALPPVYDAPVIVHRYMPPWVSGEVLEVVRLMETGGWTIKPGGVGRLWCRHPRVENRGWLDFEIAVEIERVFFLARRMKGTRNV
jgi:hypothetical protein